MVLARRQAGAGGAGRAGINLSAMGWPQPSIYLQGARVTRMPRVNTITKANFKIAAKPSPPERNGPLFYRIPPIASFFCRDVSSVTVCTHRAAVSISISTAAGKTNANGFLSRVID